MSFSCKPAFIFFALIKDLIYEKIALTVILFKFEPCCYKKVGKFYRKSGEEWMTEVIMSTDYD